MARINLLPWREELRERKKREFFVILAAAGLFGLLIFLGGVYQVKLMHQNQEQRNDMLSDEIKTLDEQIAEIDTIEILKQQLITKKQTIEDLQTNRTEIVKLFDQIVRTIPDGVRLTEVKQTGRTLTLSGVADSNSKVSAYMNALNSSAILAGTDLSLTERQGDGRQVEYDFVLQVKIDRGEQAQEQAAEGAQA